MLNLVGDIFLLADQFPNSDDSLVRVVYTPVELAGQDRQLLPLVRSRQTPA